MKKAYALGQDSAHLLEKEAAARQEKVEKSLPLLWETTVLKIDHKIYRHGLFHIIAIACILLQVFLLLGTLLILPYSSMVAVELALLFLSSFSYLSLRSYFSAKLPEELQRDYQDYAAECRQIIEYAERDAESYGLMNYALSEFASYIHEREYDYFAWIFNRWKGSTQIAERLSCLLHWRLVHMMQEFLLEGAMQECIKQVKIAPTQIPSHAELANAYILLSGIYTDPVRLQNQSENDRWYPSERYSVEMKENFRYWAQRAIEELTILDHYAPNQPWIHLQLAYSYNDLQMPKEEIREYESILSLIPNDTETLFKLGILYLQQGYNAKALYMYEQLGSIKPDLAEELIWAYGANHRKV